VSPKNLGETLQRVEEYLNGGGVEV
jgi:hypothetical protein